MPTRTIVINVSFSKGYAHLYCAVLSAEEEARTNC